MQHLLSTPPLLSFIPITGHKKSDQVGVLNMFSSTILTYDQRDFPLPLPVLLIDFRSRECASLLGTGEFCFVANFHITEDQGSI